MVQPRSPRYPAIGLPEAIEGVRAVYKKEHLNKVDQEVVAKRLGSSSLNGRALSRISALRKYGLLGGTGEELQVTQDAVIIIADPVESPERRAVISQAAERPTLFAKLFKRYAEQPPSEEALRSYLIKEGFTSKGVSKAAKAFLATMDLVTQEGIGYGSTQSEQIETEDTMEPAGSGEHSPLGTPRPGGRRASYQPLTGEHEFVRGRLSREGGFRLLVSGDMGPKELGKLIRVLTLQKELLVDEEPSEEDEEA